MRSYGSKRDSGATTATTYWKTVNHGGFIINWHTCDRQSAYATIPSSKEEKPQLMYVYNQDEFFVEPKEVEQDIALEEVFITAEIPE